MQKINLTKSIFLLVTLTATFLNAVAQKNWTLLYNGKDLSGWDTYIGPDLDSNGKMLTRIPVGLNKDPKQVFTIVEQNGEKLIRISGESWGGISTLKEYDNFHLKLKFKWGNLSWGQKKNKKKDSGLLYYAVGQHGADYGAWMRSQEFQIEEGNSGDYWGVAGGIEDIRTINKGTDYTYDPKGELIAFSAGSKAGRHCIKRGDAENASGEWNELELYSFRGTSVHVINGKVMMVLLNSRQSDNGIETPLIKGKLQIQSEGAEVFYKDIKIRSLSSIPKSLMK